jgi:hypothetical protein
MTFNVFYNSIAVSVLYILTKFLEMRFINKESKPLKHLFRDGVIVYLCSIGGYYLIQQFELPNQISKKVSAFTNDPNF